MLWPVRASWNTKELHWSNRRILVCRGRQRGAQPLKRASRKGLGSSWPPPHCSRGWSPGLSQVWPLRPVTWDKLHLHLTWGITVPSLTSGVLRGPSGIMTREHGENGRPCYLRLCPKHRKHRLGKSLILLVHTVFCEVIVTQLLLCSGTSIWKSSFQEGKIPQETCETLAAFPNTSCDSSSPESRMWTGWPLGLNATLVCWETQ